MSNREAYEHLLENGKLDYGSVISAEEVRKAFGIDEIEYPAMRHEIVNQELAELGAVDYIRNRLLNLGRYIKGSGEHYRVLLPSENATQVLAYMESADRKLKRALKLNKNTPIEHKVPNGEEVRMFMKREHIKEQRSS